MAAKNHWVGKDLKSVWYIDNDKTIFDQMSFDCQAVGTTVTDGVLGANRTLNDFILDHYKISVEIQQKSREALKQVLKIQENRDANAIELVTVLGLVIEFRDATRALFTISDITMLDWKFAVSGRADRNKFTLPIIANEFKEL